MKIKSVSLYMHSKTICRGFAELCELSMVLKHCLVGFRRSSDWFREWLMLLLFCWHDNYVHKPFEI